MTVAAVIVCDSVREALADTAGRPAVRRMVESAWAGGATPIVVVSPDVEAQVAAALAGSPAVLAEPAAPGAAAEFGRQAVRGVRVAIGRVGDTDAALLWPGRMVWVDAETVTTLIEVHGLERGVALQPTHSAVPGWPVLLPLALSGSVPEGPPAVAGAPDGVLESLRAQGVAIREIETGDPGVIHDVATPLDALPEYSGPPEPVKQPPEWGVAAADTADEAPLQGPALAPYGQAADEGE